MDLELFQDRLNSENHVGMFGIYFFFVFGTDVFSRTTDVFSQSTDVFSRTPKTYKNLHTLNTLEQRGIIVFGIGLGNNEFPNAVPTIIKPQGG